MDLMTRVIASENNGEVDMNCNSRNAKRNVLYHAMDEKDVKS